MVRPTDAGVPRDKRVNARFTEREHDRLEAQRDKRGIESTSNYIRFLVKEDGKALGDSSAE